MGNVLFAYGPRRKELFGHISIHSMLKIRLISNSEGKERQRTMNQNKHIHWIQSQWITLRALTRRLARFEQTLERFNRCEVASESEPTLAEGVKG